MIIYQSIIFYCLAGLQSRRVQNLFLAPFHQWDCCNVVLRVEQNRSFNGVILKTKRLWISLIIGNQIIFLLSIIQTFGVLDNKLGLCRKSREPRSSRGLSLVRSRTDCTFITWPSRAVPSAAGVGWAVTGKPHISDVWTSSNWELNGVPFVSVMLFFFLLFICFLTQCDGNDVGGTKPEARLACLS